MIIVTGGAGFIGSAIIAALNTRGCDDILVVDNIDHEQKGRNLRSLRFRETIGVDEFRLRLRQGFYDQFDVSGVLHLGACSDTTEDNWDYLQDNNVNYSKELILWCFRNNVRCIYASSAATYGDGALGFSDDPELFDQFAPLNPYGKSKLLVDIWARDEGLLEVTAGVRYFNVFGPNEWHKGVMRSVVNKKFPEISEDLPFTLFKSYDPSYPDGGQERDFIYVKDAVDVSLWLLENTIANGVFNVGTGVARTWNDLARAMFVALKKPEQISYIDMPEKLRNQYQYHTQADMSKLRSVGYRRRFTSLEEAIEDYVQNYLLPNKHLGEER